MTERNTSIRFRLDIRTGVAPYRQIVDQVCSAVASGALLAGDQLPPVREVVSHVTVNPNTVQRAYKELEHMGVTVAKWGQGSFVSDRAKSIIETSDSPVMAALNRYIEAVRNEGITPKNALKLVSEALKRRGVEA